MMGPQPPRARIGGVVLRSEVVRFVDVELLPQIVGFGEAALLR